jgi:peptidyl-prolyl cis-trans isomerase D
VLSAAFTAAQGAAPAFHKTPGDNDFILSVNKITPPQLKPYGSVKKAVLADWTAHQLEHAQNIAAAQLLSAVKSGQTLAQAASAAGLPVTVVGPFGRSKLPKPLPKRLLPILFALKQGQPTMVETRIGFVVATVTAITPPSGHIADKLHTQLAKVLDNSMQTAILQSFATGLRHRDNVKINAKVVHQISS